LKASTAIGRDEREPFAKRFALHNRGPRKELDEAIKNLLIPLTGNISILRSELSKDNTELKQQLTGDASQNREELKNSLNDLSESLVRKLTDLSATQQQQSDNLRKTLETQLEGIRQNNETKLEQMRLTVDEKLHTTLEKRLGESFQIVSDRLELVHKSMGEMQTLAKGVGNLEKVLSNVKNRGVTGRKCSLATTLEDLLSPSQYEKTQPNKPPPTKSVRKRDSASWPVMIEKENYIPAHWMPNFPSKTINAFWTPMTQEISPRLKPSVRIWQTGLKAVHEISAINTSILQLPQTLACFSYLSKACTPRL
jgi:hypothetical protein